VDVNFGSSSSFANHRRNSRRSAGSHQLTGHFDERHAVLVIAAPVAGHVGHAAQVAARIEAMAAREAVTVLGDPHYLRANHFLTRSSVPIHQGTNAIGTTGFPCLKHQRASRDRHDEEHDEQDEEDDEANFRDARRAGRHAGKAEQTGDYGNDREKNGEFKHGESPLLWLSDLANCKLHAFPSVDVLSIDR
jgi:hypothetical protein